MKLLKCDLIFQIDDVRTLSEGLRALADFLDANPKNIEKIGIAESYSHAGFFWNWRLGAKVNGKAGIWELRHNNIWVQINPDSSTFICR